MLKNILILAVILSTQISFADVNPQKFFNTTNDLAEIMGLSVKAKQFQRVLVGEYGCKLHAEIKRADESGLIREINISINGSQFILSDINTVVLSIEKENGRLMIESMNSYNFPDQQYQALEIAPQGSSAIVSSKESRKTTQACGWLKLNFSNN